MKQFFTDDNGRLSMTRLCTLIIVLCGCAFCFVWPLEWYGGCTIIMLGLTGKIAQKRLSETKSK